MPSAVGFYRKLRFENTIYVDLIFASRDQNIEVLVYTDYKEW